MNINKLQIELGRKKPGRKVMMVRDDLAAQIQQLATEREHTLQYVTDVLLSYALANVEPSSDSGRTKENGAPKPDSPTTKNPTMPRLRNCRRVWP